MRVALVREESFIFAAQSVGIWITDEHDTGIVAESGSRS
jgi:hypothetical protein